MFREALIELASNEPADNGVVATLEKICTLYGCWAIEENAQHFLKYRFFSPSQMDAITAEVTRLCAELRNCAVLLTDSFDLSDHIVRRSSSCSHSPEPPTDALDRARATAQLAARPVRRRHLQPLLCARPGGQPARAGRALL